MSRQTTVSNRVFVESLFRFLFLAEIEEKRREMKGRVSRLKKDLPEKRVTR